VSSGSIIPNLSERSSISSNLQVINNEVQEFAIMSQGEEEEDVREAIKEEIKDEAHEVQDAEEGGVDQEEEEEEE
jgi:hypothetical protein